MRIRMFLALFVLILLVSYSACYVINFSKDFEFDLSFEVNSDTTSLNESYLLDAVTDIAGFEENANYIETIEIKSVACYLESFIGTDDQTFTNGLLTVCDENGSGSQVLTAIPALQLHTLLNTEKGLDLDEAGISLVEDLIKNSPHKCKGILTGDLSNSPAIFTMKFHIALTITGSLL